MYYIEEEIDLHIDGYIETYGFFFIFKVATDYNNEITEFMVSCWRDKEHWLNFDKEDESGTQEADRVLVFSIDKCPDFNVDPSNFCLLHLVATQNSIFFNKRVKKDYEIQSIKNARLKHKEIPYESISSK